MSANIYHENPDDAGYTVIDDVGLPAFVIKDQHGTVVAELARVHDGRLELIGIDPSIAAQYGLQLDAEGKVVLFS